MKIATFNIKDLFGEGVLNFYGKEFTLTPEFIEQRTNSLSVAISSIDADIVVLQEVASEKVLMSLVEKIGIDYSVFIAKPDKRGIGNAVLYRDAAECSSFFSLGPLPVFVEGDEDIYGKRLDHSRVRDFIQIESIYKEKPLHIFGVHLKSSNGVNRKDIGGAEIIPDTQTDAAETLIRSRLHQFSQAINLRQRVDTILSVNPDAQIVVLGDFNNEEKDDCMRIIKGSSKKLPGILINTCDDIPSEKRFSSLNDGKKRLIDHILISESLKGYLQKITILNEYLVDQTLDPRNPLIPESDHAPVLIELQ